MQNRGALSERPASMRAPRNGGRPGSHSGDRKPNARHAVCLMVARMREHNSSVGTLTITSDCLASIFAGRSGFGVPVDTLAVQSGHEAGLQYSFRIRAQLISTIAHSCFDYVGPRGVQARRPGARTGLGRGLPRRPPVGMGPTNDCFCIQQGGPGCIPGRHTGNLDYSKRSACSKRLAIPIFMTHRAAATCSWPVFLCEERAARWPSSPTTSCTVLLTGFLSCTSPRMIQVPGGDEGASLASILPRGTYLHAAAESQCPRCTLQLHLRPGSPIPDPSPLHDSWRHHPRPRHPAPPPGPRRRGCLPAGLGPEPGGPPLSGRALLPGAPLRQPGHPGPDVARCAGYPAGHLTAPALHDCLAERGCPARRPGRAPLPAPTNSARALSAILSFFKCTRLTTVMAAQDSRPAPGV